MTFPMRILSDWERTISNFFKLNNIILSNFFSNLKQIVRTL